MEFSDSSDTTLDAAGAAFDHLSAIVGKTHLLLVELDTVTDNRLDGRAGQQLGVESRFLDGLLLAQGTLICKIIQSMMISKISLKIY